MKNLSLLVWLTQLGLSTAAPLAGFTLLGVWLRNRYDLGLWVVLVGIGLGIFGAVDGLRTSMRTLEKLSKKAQKNADKPSLNFNDHD